MTRIAPNDPTLAHALANRQQTIDSEQTLRLRRTPSITTVKAFVTAMTKLGDRLLDLEVVRATGSRAKAIALILDPTVNGMGYTFARIEFDARTTPRVIVRTSKILVFNHAIARLFQRSIGSADMVRVADLLTFHGAAIATWFIANDGNPSDGEIVTAGKGGAFLGNTEGGRVLLRTWVDAATASNPELRRLASRDEITVRFTPD